MRISADGGEPRKGSWRTGAPSSSSNSSAGAGGGVSSGVAVLKAVPPSSESGWMAVTVKEVPLESAGDGTDEGEKGGHNAGWRAAAVNTSSSSSSSSSSASAKDGWKAATRRAPP